MENYIDHKKRNSDLESRSRPVQPRIGEYRFESTYNSRPKKPHNKPEFLRSCANLRGFSSKYAFPLLTAINLVLIANTTLNRSQSEIDEYKTSSVAQTNNIQISSLTSDCFNSSGLEDGEDTSFKGELESNPKQLPLNANLLVSQTVESMPMTVTYKGTTPPVSNFPPLPDSPLKNNNIMICDNEYEPGKLTTVDTANNQMENTKKLSELAIHSITISSEGLENIVSLKELNIPGLVGPQEPTIDFFPNLDDPNEATMAIANNNGLIFHKVRQEGTEILIQPTSDYIPLYKLIKDEQCRIWSDVYLRKGPNNEIYLIAVDLKNQDSNCLLKANSVKEAQEQGFSVNQIQWPGANLADFITIDSQNIDGQNYLIATINALIKTGNEQPGEYFGQPVALIQDKGNTFEGKFFAPRNIIGQSANPVSNFRTTNGEILALRAIGGTTPNGIFTDQISSYLINPETNTAQINENILSISLEAANGGCKTHTVTKERICIPQYGSDNGVSETTRYLNKVIEPVLTEDGQLLLPYQAIIDTEPEENLVKTDLFISQLILSPDGQLTQGLSTIYKLQDQNGRKINFTDPLVHILPDKSMQVFAVALDIENSNSLITFRLDKEGNPVGDANILQSTQNPFPGGANNRSGDYSDLSTKWKEITAYSFFVGRESMTALQFPLGYTVRVISPQEPQPTPTIEPTATPGNSKSLFLPITRK